MTPLRKWMIDELVRRNYGERTIKPYVAAVAAIAKSLKKSPDRLTADALLAAITDGCDRVIVTVAYACGLRVSQLASLRVADVDGARKLLHIHAGKGPIPPARPAPALHPAALFRVPRQHEEA